jgi:hypothetical protein
VIERGKAMTYRTGTPTLGGVVGQIGKKETLEKPPAIQENGRAVRLSKGKGAAGEIIYGIRTRPIAKGREWNFARRIAQERALVEKFEKEIDTRCGKKGMGRKLTKGVGAYDKFFNPKLDAAQLRRLEKRADQIEKVGQPPPGLKLQFDDDDNLMWVGRFEMNAQARTTIKSGLSIELNKQFQKPKHEGDSGQELGISEQCLKDWNRSNRLLNGTNLRYCQKADVEPKLRDFVGGDGLAAHNFSVLLTQAVFADLLFAYQKRTGSVVLDASQDNVLTFDANKNKDNFVIACTSQRKVGSISDKYEKMYYFNPNKSLVTESITLAADLGTLGNGNTKGIKLAGDPFIDFVLYPIPQEESTV